jgi:uncharacterized protein
VPTTPVVTQESARPAPTAVERLAEAERAFAARRYEEAITLFKPLGDAGNAPAELRLGEIYAEGRGVERDASVARQWYEKAALQGEVGAQIKLGDMYAKGNGVTQNNNLAYVWYGAAAKLGSSYGRTEQAKIAPLLQPAERDQLQRVIDDKVKGMSKSS